jgi:transglutaminase-like putative cysteine protease
VSELWDRFRYPRAGWLSLGLLMVMALSVAWSVQDAGWLDQLEYLAPLAVWAVLFGGLIGVVRGSILLSLPLGALIGAGFVLWAIGGEYHATLSQLGRLEALRDDAILFTASLFEGGYPLQMSPYAVGLGILMWATAFTAAYVVYRYHRVMDALLLLGAAIVTNMSAAVTGIGHLLLFVIAALLLWLRAALVNRQDGWQRRRVNENIEVPPSIMRTGIIFAAGSVLLAYVLTTVAIAAPLTGAWRSLDGVWTGVRDQLEGVVGGLTNPNSRITGSSFGPSFTVFGEWVSNDEEVLVLAAEDPLYLRTRTYDIYNGRGWESTEGPRRGVAAGDPLFEVPTSERPTAKEGEGVRLDSISIEMRQSVGRQIFTAGSPLKVYAPVLITEPAGLPLLGFIEAANPIGDGESYTQAVLIPEATEAQLAAAGTDYPQAIRDLYLSTRGISPQVEALAREVTEGAESPYEQAKRLSRYLRGEEFTYSTAGLEIPSGADLVDTFLFGENGKVGYCQHYASAMALMARSLGLPARVAVGWAPGEAAGEDLWLVREAQAHAWVEIYFPGYGWQIFEATKSIDPRFIRAAGDDGDPIAPPTSEGFDVWFQEDLERALQERGQIPVLPSAVPVEGAIDPTDPDPAPVENEAREGNAVVMIVLVLAAAVVIFFQARRSRRRWRLLPAGDRAWQHLTLAADRAGVGPRPSETIYEYAGWLEEQLPRHGEPIRVVADGKVWQNYSGRPLTRSGANRLEVAWARLRRPLMMLGLRRRFRRLARRDRPAG